MRERNWTIPLGVVLLVTLVLAIMLGPYPLSPAQIFAELTGRGAGGPESTVFWNIRLPRVLAAALVGAALAAAGAAYQSAFRNPLVSPDILGVSAGAGLGAVLGIYLGLPVLMIQLLGFGAGLATVILVVSLSLAIGAAPLVMVLCGIAIGALAGAGISLIKLLADPDNQLPAITFWLMGSLAGVKRGDLWASAPAILAGIVPLIALRWRIGLLALGDDEARSLGVNAGFLRGVVVLGATLVTAAAVSMAGTIGWVGLMVPHMMRLLTGPRFDRLLPASILGGAAFMVLVDCVARSIARQEVPLGILTAVLGAPIFIFLLARGAAQWRQ